MTPHFVGLLAILLAVGLFLASCTTVAVEDNRMRLEQIGAVRAK